MADAIVTKESMSWLLTADTNIGVHTEFLWHTDDPCTVTVTFRRSQQWLIGRDLLFAGMVAPAGDPMHGDVQVAPFGPDHPMDARLSLCTPSGSATFRLNGRDVMSFLNRTEDVVPKGTESYDWDLYARTWFGVGS